MQRLWKLFSSFFLIGGLTFGGGYAMLPLLEREVVERHHWATSEELLDYFAIGQCTPGVIAVNTATIVGYRQGKLLGAAAATLGVVTPSLLIIMSLAGVLQQFSHLEWVSHAFGGIRAVVCVLIFSAVMKMFQKSIVDRFTLVLFLLSLVVMLWFDVTPIYLVLASGLIGWLVQRRRKGEPS